MGNKNKKLNHHPFEIPVTMHYLYQYLKPGGHIFDVAVGQADLQVYCYHRIKQQAQIQSISGQSQLYSESLFSCDTSYPAGQKLAYAKIHFNVS